MSLNILPKHKHQNREAIYYPYLVELNSLAKKNIAQYEEKEHSCIWIDEDKIGEISLFENHRMMVNEALKK